MPFFLIFLGLAFGIPLVFAGAGAITDITNALTVATIGGILAFVGLQLAF